jgi:hypothetical protein
MIGRLIQAIGILTIAAALWFAWPILVSLWTDESPIGPLWLVTNLGAATRNFIAYVELMAMIAPGIALFYFGASITQDRKSEGES